MPYIDGEMFQRTESPIWGSPTIFSPAWSSIMHTRSGAQTTVGNPAPNEYMTRPSGPAAGRVLFASPFFTDTYGFERRWREGYVRFWMIVFWNWTGTGDALCLTWQHFRQNVGRYRKAVSLLKSLDLRAVIVLLQKRRQGFRWRIDLRDALNCDARLGCSNWS